MASANSRWMDGRMDGRTDAGYFIVPLLGFFETSGEQKKLITWKITGIEWARRMQRESRCTCVGVATWYAAPVKTLNYSDATPRLEYQIYHRLLPHQETANNSTQPN